MNFLLRPAATNAVAVFLLVITTITFSVQFCRMTHYTDYSQRRTRRESWGGHDWIYKRSIDEVYVITAWAACGLK
ncbi:hypothetical protein Pcaca05_14680 [Pectobacterium carotovorum subsp. carotovorum]|nr:hypothetical protein Pcaca05_14680 [Pectobacterium carotovorum subsp. carotovorum]